MAPRSVCWILVYGGWVEAAYPDSTACTAEANHSLRGVLLSRLGTEHIGGRLKCPVQLGLRRRPSRCGCSLNRGLTGGEELEAQGAVRETRVLPGRRLWADCGLARRMLQDRGLRVNEGTISHESRMQQIRTLGSTSGEGTRNQGGG